MFLVVWPGLPPEFGGIQSFGAELLRWLDRSDKKYYCITDNPDDLHEFDDELRIRPNRLITGTFEKDYAAIRSLVDALDPEVTITNHPAYVPAFGGRKVVLRLAGNETHRPWHGPGDIRGKRRGRLSAPSRLRRVQQNREWIKAIDYSNCDVVVNSDFTAELVKNYIPGGTRKIVGGVNLSTFKPAPMTIAREELGLSQDGQIFISACRLVAKKGIDIALEALALIKDQNFRYIVAGLGSELPKLICMVSELALGDKVTFTGALSHEKLAKYLAASDLHIAPSKTVFDTHRCSYDFETMGRIVCEAAACGVPTIGSNAGGLTEVVRVNETGRLFDEGDAVGLAEQIKAIDRGARQSLSAKALSIAQREWGYDTVFNELLIQY